MKTIHQNKKEGHLKITNWVIIILVMSVAFILSSCKGSSSGSGQDIYGIQNCLNCGFIQNGGQTFFQSQSTDVSGKLSLSLNFMGSGYGYGGSPYGMQGYYSGMASPIVSYQGSVAAVGQLHIHQTSGNYNGCIIPAGVYTLQTVQAGTWNSGIVTGLMMQAYGSGIVLNIQISQAQVGAKAATGATWSEVPPVGKLFGNVNVQSSVGYNCRMSALVQ